MEVRVPRPLRGFLLTAAALVALCLLSPLQAASIGTARGKPAWLKAALNALPVLRVQAAGSMSGYARAKFGNPWKDVDHNHCDTRNDVLNRDLKQITLKIGSGCAVQTGTLKDPYTGQTIHFVRGVETSGEVQIDHVVALADAWRTGAAKWTAARRLAYANDPFILLAVDGPSNESKGDSDAAEWLPPKRSFDCRYAAMQVEIKKKYSLWLTVAEHDKIAKLLANC
jgi:Protein of unknown function (DUF1524)